jgi:hypothetical protein
MRIGPSEYLLFRKGRLALLVAPASVFSEQSGQRGAARKAARAKAQRSLDCAPALPRSFWNRTGLDYRPFAHSLMMLISPLQHLFNRQRWQI